MNRLFRYRSVFLIGIVIFLALFLFLQLYAPTKTIHRGHSGNQTGWNPNKPYLLAGSNRFKDLPIFMISEPTIEKICYIFGITRNYGVSFENKISIEYPSVIRAGDSGIVRVRMDCIGSDIENPCNPRLKESITLGLFCSNFLIQPDVRIRKSIGDSPPLVWSWSITPQKEGKQELILDLSDIKLSRFLPGRKGDNLYTLTIQKNQQQVNPGDDFIHQQVVRIEVLTWAGIPIAWYNGIGIFFGLMAALCGYVWAWIMKKEEQPR